MNSYNMKCVTYSKGKLKRDMSSALTTNDTFYWETVSPRGQSLCGIMSQSALQPACSLLLKLGYTCVCMCIWYGSRSVWHVPAHQFAATGIPIVTNQWARSWRQPAQCSLIVATQGSLTIPPAAWGSPAQSVAAAGICWETCFKMPFCHDYLK